MAIKVVSWSPPVGVLEFNVDGAIRGSPRPAGIGGVRWNSDGIIRAMFSKPSWS